MKHDTTLLVLALADIGGTLATYCDRTEHNEAAKKESITQMGWQLRSLAVSTASIHGVDLKSLYASRLGGIERKHPAHAVAGFDGEKAVNSATTWADVQGAQYLHDLAYHADVAGLAKFDQLRHYTLHVAKLAKCALDVSRTDSDDEWQLFLQLRVPDMAVFGVKLATVAGEKLPHNRLTVPPTASVERALVPGVSA